MRARWDTESTRSTQPGHETGDSECEWLKFNHIDKILKLKENIDINNQIDCTKVLPVLI